jgi:hypothetical protein
MLAAAIGLIVAGLLLGLFLGFFGFIVMAVGLVLFILWLVALMRAEPSRAQSPPPAD